MQSRNEPPATENKTKVNYFVTAIGTDSGKTLVSAIFCEALLADYWKPVQAGTPRDTEQVRKLISNTTTNFHPEAYLLQTPASPHAAAKIDGLKITLADFKVPVSSNRLIIEGAGGCLVPLNDADFIIDLIPLFQAQAIVVANLYLGSINHTLLTFEALRKRDIPVRGLVFNGDRNEESEQIILKHTSAKCLLRIGQEASINADVVRKYATLLKHTLNE
jgi:dethiobiotin synthetase